MNAPDVNKGTQGPTLVRYPPAVPITVKIPPMIPFRTWCAIAEDCPEVKLFVMPPTKSTNASSPTIKLGTHYLVDFRECNSLPEDERILLEVLVEGVKRSGATIVQTCAHQFSPHGLSAVIVIAESHLAAHTWPEHKAMCIDLFSCSDKINSDAAIQWIAEAVGATHASQRVELRMA